MNTAFFWTPAFLKHDTGPGHPEQPARLTAILDALRDPEFSVWDELTRYTPGAASEKKLLAVHTQAYIRRVREACRNSERLDPDTPASPDSWEAALAAAGAGCDAVDFVFDQPEDAAAFCAVRPPGHHAGREQAMGFCLFNNIAVAAAHAMTHPALKRDPRIFILDWDVHHGNGTQEIFYDSKKVFYASLHQYPFYPGTGSAKESGSGPGAGFTLNCPQPSGASDVEILADLTARILPALRKFRPNLVLISAGFDAHQDDPLGELDLTSSCYAEMTRRLIDALHESPAPAKIVSILEGGYNLRALGESVAHHLRALVDG